MSFYNFLKDKLNYPLCYLSSVFESLFIAVSKAFDKLVENAFLLQKEFFCFESKNIIKYIEDRKINTIADEPVENIENRTRNAFKFFADTIYMKTIENIVKMITQKPFFIIQTNKDSLYIGDFFVGEADIKGWPFTYALSFQDVLTEEEKALISDTLREYIKAYIDVKIMSITVFSEFIIGESFTGNIKI